MKKLTPILFVMAVISTGCTYQVSQGISEDGTQVKSLVFPNQDDAWRKQGIFPVKENLRHIHAGTSKKAIYDLIGTPHFSEAQNAKEWDYIFKFKDEITNQIETCQFKIVFDKEYLGQSFYWQPSTCAEHLNKTPNKKGQQTVALNPLIETTNDKKLTANGSNTIIEVVDLDADALFAFNQSNLNAMSLDGKKSLTDLATKIKTYHLTDKISIELIGHTDRLGSKLHNQQLSQKRANAVESFLVSKGINRNSIKVFAAADSNPKTTCYGITNKQALIACLKPNRRVEVKVKRY